MKSDVGRSRQAPLHADRPDGSERVVAWVERHCAEQGVAVKVTDPLVLAKVADILLEGSRETDLGRQVARLGQCSGMTPERRRGAGCSEQRAGAGGSREGSRGCN
jgi:hypothetical protein